MTLRTEYTGGLDLAVSEARKKGYDIVTYTGAGFTYPFTYTQPITSDPLDPAYDPNFVPVLNGTTGQNGETGQLDFIRGQMSQAASNGQKEFSVSLPVSYKPSAMRTEGYLWDAYRAGIMQGLYNQDLVVSDFNITLDKSDSDNLYTVITFTF